MRLKQILKLGMGILLLGLRGTRADSLPLQEEKPLSSLDALVEQYIHFRMGVWRMHPPITDQEAPPALQEQGGGWYENAWSRWLALPGWFAGFQSSSNRMDTALAGKIWKKSNPADLRVWEHPGRQKIYVSLATEPERYIAEFPAPEWKMVPGPR